MDHNTLISLYLHEFGPSLYKGYGYMKQILLRYMETALSAERTDYNRLVAEVAAEADVRPDTVRSAIQRYVASYWKRGFSRGWKSCAGWDNNYPPNVNTAIRLICESFIPIIKNIKIRFRECK